MTGDDQRGEKSKRWDKVCMVGTAQMLYNASFLPSSDAGILTQAPGLGSPDDAI